MKKAKDKVPSKASDSLLHIEDSDLQVHAQETSDLLTTDDAVQTLMAAPLSRVQLLISRLRVFDLFKNTGRLLARRPFKLLSRVATAEGTMSIMLRITTQRAQVERNAVSVTAHYYSFWGSEVAVSDELQTQSFFADPAEAVIEQPCYFTPPKSAFWVQLTMQRLVRERRIAVRGSLRPKVYVAQRASLEAALVSRDEAQLRLHLECAAAASNRAQARRLLSRLIFLKRRPEDEQTLKVVADIDALLLQPYQMAAPDKLTQSKVFEYTQTFLKPYDGSYPLSKWLTAEAQHLNAASGGNAVSIADGPHLSLRLMALTVLGAPLSGEKIEAKIIASAPWLTADEVCAFAGYLKT